MTIATDLNSKVFTTLSEVLDLTVFCLRRSWKRFRPKTCPHFETLRLRECAVDDIVVQKVAVFLFRLGQLRFRDRQL
jgi:hypothetical protein